MNLELLKKLIQLAGNNPNENEANIAARRACKMMYDALMAGETVTIVIDTRRRPVPPKQPGPTTWQDVRRSAEPEFKSKPPHGPGEPFTPPPNQKKESDYKTTYYDQMDEDIVDIINRMFNRDNQFYKNMRNDGFRNPFQTKPKPEKEERELECTKCHKKVKTKFVGHPAAFQCNDCQWTAYQNMKNRTPSW